jgi:hypothetical protein
MSRFSSGMISAALAGIAILALIVQRAENQQLRAEIQSLRERCARLSEPAMDTSRVLSPVADRNRLLESTNEPPHELLRLRGEVARLRLDLQEAQKPGPQPLEALAPGRLSDRSFTDDWYATLGVDTNGIPRTHSLCTANEVLAELQRVGAEILTDEEQVDSTRYIHAVARPTTTVTTEGKIVSVGLQFWFKDGLLEQRRDSPKWQLGHASVK